ncbi:MAG: thioredoxin domain-containing protein, partial [Acidobacteria bacterium]|nr:thioredoxin domain-containing protein [Acidobacteriota bacterium]
GWFFTWTPAELAAVLDDEERRVVTAHYGVTEQGNFEGRTILHVAQPLAEVAGQLEWSLEQAQAKLDSATYKLYRQRANRPPPLLDDKILTSWNGLMISAFARAGFVFDVPEYTARAAGAADLLLSALRRDGRLLRSYKDGIARHNAYLEDYAFLISGLLDLFETTGEPQWFGEAVSLQKSLDTHYGDAEKGGYFVTSGDHEALLAREKPGRDGAEPSGNSVAAMNLLRLHELTTDDAYRAAARRLFGAFQETLTRAPRALTEMLLAVDFKLGRPKEIVLVHRGETALIEPFLDVLRSEFLPRQVLVHASEAQVKALGDRLPILKGKRAGSRGVTAYVCEAGVCALPTSDVERFRRQLLEPVDEPQPSKKIG